MACTQLCPAARRIASLVASSGLTGMFILKLTPWISHHEAQTATKSSQGKSFIGVGTPCAPKSGLPPASRQGFQRHADLGGAALQFLLLSWTTPEGTLIPASAPSTSRLQQVAFSKFMQVARACREPCGILVFLYCPQWRFHVETTLTSITRAYCIKFFAGSKAKRSSTFILARRARLGRLPRPGNLAEDTESLA